MNYPAVLIAARLNVKNLCLALVCSVPVAMAVAMVETVWQRQAAEQVNAAAVAAAIAQLAIKNIY